MMVPTHKNTNRLALSSARTWATNVLALSTHMGGNHSLYLLLCHHVLLVFEVLLGELELWLHHLHTHVHNTSGAKR